MLLEVNSISQFETLIATYPVVLADFYADWCEPCKWLDKILEEIDDNLEKKVMIIKINSEKLLPIAQTYQIRRVPVLILFQHSHVIWRMNGFLTTEEIISKLKSISRETNNKNS